MSIDRLLTDTARDLAPTLGVSAEEVEGRLREILKAMTANAAAMEQANDAFQRHLAEVPPDRRRHHPWAGAAHTYPPPDPWAAVRVVAAKHLPR